MKNEQLFGLIMAGGIGSRFWPLSTPEMPKQFLDILGVGKSLLQLTFERLEKTIPPHQIYILTNLNYASIVAEQLPMLKEAQIICEPERKNTAPCILYAALKIKKINPNSTLIVAPSDHLILNENLFNDQLEIAISEAQKNHLVTLGVKPTRPDIGYGYIEFDSNYHRVIFIGMLEFLYGKLMLFCKLFKNINRIYWSCLIVFQLIHLQRNMI